MPPRRVAYLIWSLARGGAERQLAELVHGLDRSRYEPAVIVRRVGGERALALPVQPIELALPGPWTPLGFARLVRALRELQPDILHTFMDPENLHGRLAARLAGVETVVASVRCPALPLATRLSERLTQPLVRSWVVNSRGIRDALARDAAVPPARIRVIENGVRRDRFRPINPLRRKEIRARWGAEEGTLWTLPGRLSKEKNQAWFLEALSAAGGDDRITAVLPGDAGLDGGYVREVRRLAAASTRARVVLPGVIDDIAELLAASDVVFVPSDYEGLSNAVIEAMSCGALVAVSAGANADEVVRDGVDGLVLGPASPAAIAGAIRRARALPLERAAAMRSAARETAVSRFSVEAMAAATMAHYDALLGA
ncbi:MAG: glycosyltransferase [Polyangiales bacterium]